MKVLLDTNIIVDVLQNRSPWYADGQKIFYAIAQKQITGCMTAKQAADLYNFSRKQFVGEENADKKARSVIARLFSLLELIDSLAADCRNALVRDNKDYEDAVLIESALRAGLDGIITRNEAHFLPSPVPILSPSELAAKLDSI